MRRRRYCTGCARHVLAVFEGVPLGLHLLWAVGVVSTCGILTPVYLFYMLRGSYLCPYCGRSL